MLSRASAQAHHRDARMNGFVLKPVRLGIRATKGDVIGRGLDGSMIGSLFEGKKVMLSSGGSDHRDDGLVVRLFGSVFVMLDVMLSWQYPRIPMIGGLHGYAWKNLELMENYDMEISGKNGKSRIWKDWS